MDFNHSLLFLSARSPFARRVRLAFLEHGVSFEEKMVDVFKPNAELSGLNPLARVPTLRLANGTVLIESEKILELFYLTHPTSAFLPANDAERVTAHFWSAVSLGLCEKTIEYYLESLRPENARDPELLAEVRDVATRSIERLDATLAGRETILPGRVSQVDLDVGTALAYFSLRYSPAWMSRYSHASDFLRRMDERASFQATRPPPV